MKPALVILAAGMASRYGSMKQVEGFGPSGETIMDYSVFDAIRSGYSKVVFIIRKEFVENFRKAIGNKIEKKIQVEYVFQELNSYTEGFLVPSGRTKPWGTAHAILCASEKVHEPFTVINADDFYGRDSFKKSFNFLQDECRDNIFAIMGYRLLNTLSEYGTVNRGICEVDKSGNLVSVVERLNISLNNKIITCDDEQEPVQLSPDTEASMNFWCFSPAVFTFIEKLFKEFLADNLNKPKSEFFIPIIADRFIKEKRGIIKVIHTSSQWFGVTYKEDASMVRERLMKLIDAGEYPEKLW